MGGDGATSDIGLQSLSGALERGTNFTYVCWDNEAYMNTGIQRSSATPFGAMTTTSPPGKLSIGQATWKKDMVAIAVAHGIPYVATASPELPLRPVLQGEKGRGDPGAGLYQHPVRLPHGLALRHGPVGAPGPAGGARPASFPSLKWWTASTTSRVEPPKSGPSRIISSPRAASGISGTPRSEFIQKQIQARYKLLLEKCQAPFPEFAPVHMPEGG